MTTQTDRINGLTGALGIKAPVRVSTTANITLSGEQTIDGVAVVALDRVLVKDQTDPVENGIYDASATAWSRSPDFDGTRDAVTGTMIYVVSGTANAKTSWRIPTTGDLTPGTTSLTFEAAFGTPLIALDTHAATTKATPVDADELPLVDSAASNVLKKLTWANLKTVLAAACSAGWNAATATTATTATTAATATNTTNAGGQIPFPATQNPSADVNTLDDYEEGTWTPTVGGTATYVSNTGRYVKIGKTVHIAGILQINLIGSGSASVVSGLPFNAANVTGMNQSLAINWSSLAISVVHLIGIITVNGTTMNMVGCTAAATGLTAQNVLGNSAIVLFTGTYQATA